MKGLLSAIGFITIIPVGRVSDFKPDAMTPFFPVVGLGIGALLLLLDMALMQIWPVQTVSLLDVVFLILITGAFHLDGLGDTADGLYGRRTREEALSIMKDSRIGAMGVVAIFCGLALKWAGICGLEDQRHLLLLIIPSFARGSMLFGMKFLKYGRPHGGTGAAFFQNPITLCRFSGILIPLILTVLLGFKGLILIAGYVFILFLMLVYYKRKIGCITGDMLGAMTEVMEAGLFLLASAGEKIC